MRLFLAILSVSLWDTSNSEYSFACSPRASGKTNEMQCTPSLKFIDAMKGSKGDRGVVGIRGLKGSRGPYGNFGPLGPQGRKGDKGDTGPAGSKGDKGLIGSKGEPGENGFDLKDFQKWRLTITEEIKSLRKSVQDLGMCCTRKPYIPPHLSNREPKECLLVYKDRCFNLTGSKDGPSRTWQQYVEECESMGGGAADIYDPIHYNLTVDAIRTSRLPHSTHLMLGMRYNVFLRKLLFHNGTEANFDVPWRPSTPTTHPTHTTIQLYVRSNPYEKAQGFYNRAGNFKRQFGLCEFSVKEDESDDDIVKS